MCGYLSFFTEGARCRRLRLLIVFLDPGEYAAAFAQRFRSLSFSESLARSAKRSAVENKLACFVGILRRAKSRGAFGRSVITNSSSRH